MGILLAASAHHQVTAQQCRPALSLPHWTARGDGGLRGKGGEGGWVTGLCPVRTRETWLPENGLLGGRGALCPSLNS